MKTFIEELMRRNVVRVAVLYAISGWLILQVADVLFGLLDVPEGSLRLVLGLLLLGFPLALIFSWVYELTPEGIKREKDVDRSQSITPHTRRKIDRVIIFLLAFTVVLLLAERFVSKPSPQPEVATTQVEDTAPPTTTVGTLTEAPATAAPRRLSIAVLPFVNMSADAENEYFSDGLSEELLNVLAKIKDFHVPGRTSSFSFKGRNEDLRQIGEKLNVANILEGSVRRQGDRVRVTAQLVEVESGYHLWSETYDRKLEDIFAIQDEIATEVVTALKQTLLGDEDRAVIELRGTENMEAYNHYLRGLHLARTRSLRDLEKALEEFQTAALIDPEYAQAYTGIAMVYSLLHNYGFRNLSETGELVERAIDRALELDPQNGWAYAAKGLYIGQLPTGSSEEAIAALERAIKLNPNNAYAFMWLSSRLAPEEGERSRELLQRAYELDPLAPVILFNMVARAQAAGDTDEAWRLVKEMEEVAPNWPGTLRISGAIYLNRGQLDEAALAFTKALEMEPESPNTMNALAAVFLAWKDIEAAQELVDRGFALNPDNTAMANVQATIYANSGDAERAYEYQKAFMNRIGADTQQASNAALLALQARRPPEEARALIMEGLGWDRMPTAADLNQDTIFPLFATTFTYYAEGDGPQVEELVTALNAWLDAVEAAGFRQSFIPWARGALASLLGDRDAALRGLRAAIEQGWRGNGGPDTAYGGLWEDPEYQAIVSELEAMNLAMRTRYEAALEQPEEAAASTG